MAVIEAFGENSEQTFSSDYPALSLLQRGRVQAVYNGNELNYQANFSFVGQTILPMVFYRPEALGRYIGSRFIREVDGKLSGYGITSHVAAADGTYAGAEGYFNYAVFTGYVIEGVGDVGLQTWAESGELTFDSRSKCLKVLKVIRRQDWNLLRTESFPSADRIRYVYTVALPPGAEYIYADGQYMGTEGFFGFILNYLGFETSRSVLTMMFTRRISQMNDPPLSSLKFPIILAGAVTGG